MASLKASFNAFNERRKEISKSSDTARLGFVSYLCGFIMLGLHGLCIGFEVQKLNETINTPIADNASDEWKMDQKQKDEEKTKNKKDYTISIIALSSIMIFLILVGAVWEIFFHSDTSVIVYWVFFSIGALILIVNFALLVHKGKVYPNPKVGAINII